MRCVQFGLICAGLWISAVAAHQPFDPLTEQQKLLADVQERFIAAIAARVSKEDLSVAQGATDNTILWKEAVLDACFWNGSPSLRESIIRSANIWNNASQIRINFLLGNQPIECASSPNAQIRISLDADGPADLYEANPNNPLRDWSAIGRLAKVDKHKVTMNLVLAKNYLALNDKINFNFHVRHEFGHALGLFHEFQREICVGWLDATQIARENGWSEQETARNLAVLKSSGRSFAFFGPYDNDSIMQYNFSIQSYRPAVPPAVNPCKRDREIDAPSKFDAIALQCMYGPTPRVACEPSGSAALVVSEGDRGRIGRLSSRPVSESLSGLQARMDTKQFSFDSRLNSLRLESAREGIHSGSNLNVRLTALRDEQKRLQALHDLVNSIGRLSQKYPSLD